ncbi:bactofilin family protein [Curvibacter gracilis]|uniref:bactofilin family protein n=1 Tax=Curvibacter gracilis TaxID=230310 RepID=UPI0004B4ABA0|nr:polymer-forming cytoskeletal protein [Curvibacter gracilis]
MAIQPNFFGKRDPEGATARVQPGSSVQPAAGATSSQAHKAGASSPASPAAPVEATVKPAPAEAGSRLTVGPNIKLKGVEITDCDTLVVDGMVEATMDSRLMQISEQGSFRGAADIDLAEIKGRFEGNLNVRGKLIIHATGQVSGKIRYAKLVVEDGGQLSGDIECGLGSSPAAVRPGADVTLPAQIADAVPKSVLVL